jgi:hypothetical protein
MVDGAVVDGAVTPGWGGALPENGKDRFRRGKTAFYLGVGVNSMNQNWK